MGESFGGCLALSVAARNPDLDIVLVITNPGTCVRLSGLILYCENRVERTQCRGFPKPKPLHGLIMALKHRLRLDEPALPVETSC